MTSNSYFIIQTKLLRELVLSSLHGGSLKLTRTVPFSSIHPRRINRFCSLIVEIDVNL